MASVRGTPSFTEPSEGSERISERLICSSTKYGPIVNSGRTTQESAAAVTDGACVDVADTVGAIVGVIIEATVGFNVGINVLVTSGAAHAARRAALPTPNNLSASLRLRICPTGSSSFSIKSPLAMLI